VLNLLLISSLDYIKLRAAYMNVNFHPNYGKKKLIVHTHETVTFESFNHLLKIHSIKLTRN
jgi:hypothetical protein